MIEVSGRTTPVGEVRIDQPVAPDSDPSVDRRKEGVRH